MLLLLLTCCAPPMNRRVVQAWISSSSSISSSLQTANYCLTTTTKTTIVMMMMIQPSTNIQPIWWNKCDISELPYDSALRALEAYHRKHGDLAIPGRFVVPTTNGKKEVVSEIGNVSMWLLLGAHQKYNILPIPIHQNTPLNGMELKLLDIYTI